MGKVKDMYASTVNETYSKSINKTQSEIIPFVLFQQ